MKRQSGSSGYEPLTIGGPFKSNSRSRYVELVLVVDSKSFENQDKDLKRVFRRCKDIANIVNAVSPSIRVANLFVYQVVFFSRVESVSHFFFQLSLIIIAF